MPGPVEPEYHHESTLLQTVNQLITKYGDDPNYIVKSKKSPLHSYSVEELKKIRDGIYEKRRATQPLSKQLQQRKQSLKSTPPSKSKESPPTSLEKAVMSRRPFVEPSDDEEDFSEEDWETEGSGIASADKLIHRGRQVSHDLTINFQPPIHLGSGNYKAALSKQHNELLMVQDRCLFW